MKVTRDMIVAARRGEYDYHQRNRTLGPGPFRPTPDAVIRAMLEAALSDISDGPVAAATDTVDITERGNVRGLAITPIRRVVTAYKPRPKR
jgi:hypothetical protein